MRSDRSNQWSAGRNSLPPSATKPTTRGPANTSSRRHSSSSRLARKDGHTRSRSRRHFDRPPPHDRFPPSSAFTSRHPTRNMVLFQRPTRTTVTWPVCRWHRSNAAAPSASARSRYSHRASTALLPQRPFFQFIFTKRWQIPCTQGIKPARPKQLEWRPVFLSRRRRSL